jgi:hypothetical protein
VGKLGGGMWGGGKQNWFTSDVNVSRRFVNLIIVAFTLSADRQGRDLTRFLTLMVLNDNSFK